MYRKYMSKFRNNKERSMQHPPSIHPPPTSTSTTLAPTTPMSVHHHHHHHHRSQYPPRPSPSMLTRSHRSPEARRPRSAVIAIDLTESSPIRAGSEEHETKRRRVFESVDLTEPDEDRLMRRQREDLLKTQEAARESERRKVAGFTCVICMEDEPKDLAVTPCGHMFCHKCLHGAIKASAVPQNKASGRCPVCRGKVGLKDVIPMEFKILSKSQGKQKAV